MKYAIYCLMICSLIFHATNMMAQSVSTPEEQIIIDHRTHSERTADVHKLLANDTLNENLITIFNRKAPRIAQEFFEYMALLGMEDISKETEDMILLSINALFTDSEKVIVVTKKGTLKTNTPLEQWIEQNKSENLSFNNFRPIENANPLFSLSMPGPGKKCYLKKENNTTYCLTFTLKQKPKNFGRETLIMWDVYIGGLEIRAGN